MRVSNVDSDRQTQRLLWPTKNTAFVVIHGAGPHRPFDALDSFVRGFWKWRTVTKQSPSEDIKWKHELKRRAGWIESYLSMVPDGKPAVDFYEYYWDCYMLRDITLGDVVDWLFQVVEGASAFHREVMPQLKLQMDPQKNTDRFKDGNFKPHGHRVLLRLLRMLAPCKFLIGPLRWWASRLLSNKIGDVVIYTSSDVRSQNYEIRQKMLSKAVEELSLLLTGKKKGDYKQVIVVGHSLGSIIAYDALNRIILDMNTGGLDGKSIRDLLTGLVTLGSPLEKTAFFYGSRAFTQQKEARRERRRRPTDLQDLPEPFLQQWILSHLHSFKRLPLPTDPSGILIEDPITDHLDKTVWLNFYHLRDLFSDPLDAYSGVYNHRCRENVRGLWKAHNIYWKSDLVYAEIAEQFFK